MRCQECGAQSAAVEACGDLFHALLAAEAENAALRRMHGLTVMTYVLQHPSLTRPWYQVWGRDALRRIFGQGEAWQAVLLESHPRGVGRARSAAAVAELKAAGPAAMPGWVTARPVLGELTVASIDPASTGDEEARILAWARSVAERRFPGDAAAG